MCEKEGIETNTTATTTEDKQCPKTTTSTTTDTPSLEEVKKLGVATPTDGEERSASPEGVDDGSSTSESGDSGCGESGDR